MPERLKAEEGSPKAATFFEEMSGMSETPINVGIDPGLECVTLKIRPVGERPCQVLLPWNVAILLAMEIAANCDRLRLVLAKREEEEL